MPQTSLGAFITLTIGSTDMTLDTADGIKNPLVFSLQENNPVKVSLSDIEAFIEKKIGHSITIPALLQPMINTGDLEIDQLLLATTGDLRLKVTIANSSSLDIYAWLILKNIKNLSLKAFGFRVSYTPDAEIVSISPSSVKAGDSFSIGGTGLTNAKAVSVGADPKTATALTIKDSKDNFFLQVTVPASQPAAAAHTVYVTTADGTTLTSPSKETLTITTA